MNTKKFTPGWELFFGTDLTSNLTDEESRILNEEYALLPSDTTTSSKQALNREGS
ncbi:MAG: hypothetical protein GY749_38280 [Desulfobacteraceae bacterium]|nr:hypothetical protein [Desulfobacteraceae bacterium]